VGVPFGLKGTVVIVHSSTGYVEVIFDEEFIGGRSLQGNCSQFRGRLCPWSGLLRIPDTQVKTQTQHSRSSTATVAHNSFSAHSTKHSVNTQPPPPSSAGSNSRSHSLASASVVLKSSHSSSRPTSSVSAVDGSQQQASKLVNLLKGSNNKNNDGSTVQEGQKKERTNPEKSKSILNMLNAPMTTVVTSTQQSRSKTSLLKSALFNAPSEAVEVHEQKQTTVVVESTEQHVLEVATVDATVELKSVLVTETHVEMAADVPAPTTNTVSPPKKDKKSTMLLVPSKLQIKKKS